MSGYSRFFLLPAALAFLAVLAGCAPSSPSAGAASPSAFSAGATRSAEAATGKPAARAGLGTGWGETRDSYTTATSFVRAQASRPAGAGRLYYNDREGFEPLLRERGLAGASSLQPAAGGLVSWGLQGGGQRSYVTRGDRTSERYVVGKKGARYEIVVRNETARRVEAVLSVDGLDVLDGRAASPAKRGYILGPHETLRVDGFRTSDSTVAAFRFSTVDRSYAALKHGDTRNVGVVGLAVFTEGSAGQHRYAEPPPNPELERRHRADPFPGR